MAASSSAACLNCGAPLAGAYCSRCGQKVARPDLTLAGFLHETTHELTHWDGKIPATLKTLLLRPGLLTRDFLEGRRVRWLAPFRVYLICSVAFFASKPVVEAITHRSARAVAGVTINADDGSRTLTPEARQQLAEGLPARIFGIERLEAAAAQGPRLNRELDAAFPKAMFVLLPVFAVLTHLAWRKTRPGYPAHLYVALHIHAAVFAAMTILAIVIGFIPSDTVAAIASVVFIVYVGWYGLVALHWIFEDSWPKSIAKSVAVAAVYFLCVGVVSFALLIYAITRMS
jgi:hypothetical protein